MRLFRLFPSPTAADLEALRRRLEAPQLALVPHEPLALLTGHPGPFGGRALAQRDDAVLLRPHEVPDELRPRVAAERTLAIGSTPVRLGARALVLGIVNVTPDSFSDGGLHATTEAAVAHGLRLVDEGADWLDIGGESTRPGAPPVSLDDELARVIPVIEALHARRPDVPLSIDTQKPKVARAAIAAGAVLVNDVSGFGDPEMPALVASAGVAACVMHRQGTPQTMQQAPRYHDVVHEVAQALDAALARAQVAGVPRERLLVDPGIGFGKTLEHNLALLRHLEVFQQLGAAGVMLGTSRKSFLGALTGGAPAAERVVSSAVTVALATASRAADVVRVHDVKATREALAVTEAIRDARRGGDRW
ncbi:MAG: dihydropteroate synthase [Myxococcaceae bacterium]|nr:dihydropteroate synthase [Myxococcaceae bacterium]